MTEPSRWDVVRADAGRLPLASKSVDCVIGSPPYTSSRIYLENGKDLGISRGTEAWISWMLDVTAEALRVSRGLVLWVVAGKTEDWNYQPARRGCCIGGGRRAGNAIA